MMSPAVLKSLSSRWWCHKFFCQCRQVLKPVHVPTKMILTTNEGLRQVLVQLCIYAVTFISYKFNCSWHVMKCCVRMIPETGSYAFGILFTTLQWSRRWLLWPGALSLRCHHCIELEANTDVLVPTWIEWKATLLPVLLTYGIAAWNPVENLPEPDLSKRDGPAGARAEIRYIPITKQIVIVIGLTP